MFLRARREKKEKDEMNECANAKQLKPQYVPLFVPFLFPAIVSSTKCTNLFFPGNAHTFLAWTLSDTWDWKGIQRLYHWQKWQFNLSALAEIWTKATLPLSKNSNRSCNLSLLPEAEFKVFFLSKICSLLFILSFCTYHVFPNHSKLVRLYFQ